MTATTEQLADARTLGREAAESAATWMEVSDVEQARRVLQMIYEGDDAMDEYLPATPNLSGEWAGSPTPRSLAEGVAGSELERLPEDEAGQLEDEIADAWEEAVSNAFFPACEGALLAYLKARGIDVLAERAEQEAGEAQAEHTAEQAVERALEDNPRYLAEEEADRAAHPFDPQGGGA